MRYHDSKAYALKNAVHWGVDTLMYRPMSMMCHLSTWLVSGHNKNARQHCFMSFNTSTILKRHRIRPQVALAFLRCRATRGNWKTQAHSGRAWTQAYSLPRKLATERRSRTHATSSNWRFFQNAKSFFRPRRHTQVTLASPSNYM